MFHDFVHFPKFFQSVELLNVWNNCVATVELNCGTKVSQKFVFQFHTVEKQIP